MLNFNPTLHYRLNAWKIAYTRLWVGGVQVSCLLSRMSCTLKYPLVQQELCLSWSYFSAFSRIAPRAPGKPESAADLPTVYNRVTNTDSASAGAIYLNDVVLNFVKVKIHLDNTFDIVRKKHCSRIDS